MRERIRQEKIPLPQQEIFSRKVIDTANDLEIQTALSNIKNLQSEIQAGIYADIRKQIEKGLSVNEAVERFKLLVAKSQDLQKMSVLDSGKH